MAGRETKATKQAMLASNHFETGESSLKNYDNLKDPQVIDLAVSGLKPDTQSETLKKIAGSKHVISSVVHEDNLLGTCSGTGRI